MVPIRSVFLHVFPLWCWLLLIAPTEAALAQSERSDPRPVVEPDTTLTEVDLQEVVIASSRVQLNLPEQTRPIAVVRAREIATLPHRSLADVLQTVPGLDVRQRGPAGVQADIGIRGGTFDQVLVLLNGVRMNDPQTGHHAFSLPVDAAAIERIEVLKGPGARIYGQDAYSGVVNVVTRRPDATRAAASLGRGEHGLREFALTGSLRGAHMLSVQGRASDGYRHNTDFTLTNLFYQGEARLRGGRVQVMAGQRDSRFGANGFYADERYRDQYEEVRTRLAAVHGVKVMPMGHSGRLASWQSTLSWRQNHDDYVFIRSAPEVYRNLHTSDVIGFESILRIPGRQSVLGTGQATGTATIPRPSPKTDPISDSGRWWSAHETLLGIDARRTWFTSTNLGERDRRALSLFLERRHTAFDGRLALTPGVAFWTADDLDPVLLPGIDASWRGHRGGTVFASWGLTSRAPTYTDLYYQDPVNLGNPDLRPERAGSVELGYRTLQPLASGSGRIRFEAAAFRRVARNLIDWSRPDPQSPWKPQNLLRVATSGVETALEWSKQADGRRESGGVRLDRISVSHAWLHSEAPETVDGISRYALEHLRHQATAVASVSIARGLRLSTRFHAFDRVNLPSYTLLHAQMQWTRGRFTLRLDGQNLLDTVYRETNLVQMPGRWLMGGIDVRI